MRRSKSEDSNSVIIFIEQDKKRTSGNMDLLDQVHNLSTGFPEPPGSNAALTSLYTSYTIEGTASPTE